MEFTAHMQIMNIHVFQKLLFDSNIEIVTDVIQLRKHDDV